MRTITTKTETITTTISRHIFLSIRNKAYNKSKLQKKRKISLSDIVIADLSMANMQNFLCNRKTIVQYINSYLFPKNSWKLCFVKCVPSQGRQTSLDFVNTMKKVL